MCLRDFSCDVQVKNVAVFCFCPENLPEAILKSFRLRTLAEEISNQLSIEYDMQLLVLIFMKICYADPQ